MCLNPVRASLPEDGGRPNLDPEGDLKLPCGKCHVCISKRSLEWATRARHEISEHEENCFLTLTYSEENLCSQFIIKSDFQKFMKKLRKKLNKKIKYMVSYEYGTKTFRPHMHAIIFGYTPPSQTYLRTTNSGSKLYVSPEIEKLWVNKDGESMGFHSIGEANEQTAYYIASYALKGKERDIYHEQTGEWKTVRDQMNVSKRPAIGATFFEKNYEQIVNSGHNIPRYYLKQLEKEYIPNHKKDFGRTLHERLNDFKEYKKKNILAEEYRENMMTNLKSKGDLENYAKLVIDSQKMDDAANALRGDMIDPQEAKRREFFKLQLKSKRDNYIASTRR